MERPKKQRCSNQWIYFDENRDSFLSQVKSIYANNILVQVDFDKLPNPANNYRFDSDFYSNGGCHEFSFSEKIKPEAFRRAFVPKDLVPLFKSSFPHLECISIENTSRECSIRIPEDVAKDPSAMQICQNQKDTNFLASYFRQFTIECPNYSHHVENYVQEHFKGVSDVTKPMAFHVVRLASDADIPFLDSTCVKQFTVCPQKKKPIPLLHIHCDAKWGHSLFIRGKYSSPEEKEGPGGMSWEKGIPLRCINSNQWVLELDHPVNKEFVFKIVKENETKEISWEKDTSESDGNHSYSPTQGIHTFTPHF
jgi:hypothetical protein